MNKSDLVNVISSKTHLSRKKAESVVNVIFNSMMNSLVQDGRIEIRGFGSFVNRHYEEYHGRNPRTGKPIHVAPKKLPYFRVGKELKLKVNK